MLLKTRTYPFSGISLMEARKERLNCVFNSLQRKVQTYEFQADAKIPVVLDYFKELIQRKNKRLVSLDRLVSLKARTLRIIHECSCFIEFIKQVVEK